MNKSVRIKDIALKAGVSTGTVDRVLHKRGRVSEEAREKVLKIINELNYEPNLMARALGSNKTYQIAALIPDYTLDPYWDDARLGIEKAEKDLRSYGISIKLYMFDPHDVKLFIKKADEITASKPDGILLSPIFYRETLVFFEKWKQMRIPFAIFNTQVTEFNPLSYIGQDSYQSGQVAGRLVHQGSPEPCYVLIAHIDEDISNSAHLVKKEQGFKDYFLDNKLPYTILRAELSRPDLKAFNRQLDGIIEQNPNLKHIYVTTSKAFEIATYLEQRGIAHIKITGYDLVPKNIDYLNKGSISFLINQNPKGQGYWGISYLTDYLVFKKEVPALKYLPLDIVVKENLSYFL